MPARKFRMIKYFLKVNKEEIEVAQIRIEPGKLTYPKNLLTFYEFNNLDIMLVGLKYNSNGVCAVWKSDDGVECNWYYTDFTASENEKVIIFPSDEGSIEKFNLFELLED